MKAKSKRKTGRSSKATTATRARRKTRATARPKTRAKAKVRAKPKTSARARSRPSPKRKAPARPKRRSTPRSKPKARAATSRTSRSVNGRWVEFVARNGIVLAAAKGPVPNVAEAVAGERIIGSWWAHKKGKAIFAALCEIDDSPDVRCFKLIDGKVTFAHRKTWPALVRLGHDGVIAPEQLSSVEQEHMPTGEHRNIVTPFPDWVDDATAAAAAKLTPEAARSQLAWIDAHA